MIANASLLLNIGGRWPPDKKSKGDRFLSSSASIKNLVQCGTRTHVLLLLRHHYQARKFALTARPKARRVSCKLYFLKNLNAENCKRGPFEIFNIHSVAEFQKIEGISFGVFKKIFENSLRVPKKGPFGIF